MRRLIIASLFLTAACGAPVRVNAPPPPDAWLVCEPEPNRPLLAPLSPQGDTYSKPQVDERDGAIARYIIDLRAAWFDCSMKLGKVRDYVRESK